MPKPNHIEAASGDVLVLVGTMKGAFLIRSNKDRKEWEVGGPYFPGRAIYAMLYDDRNGRSRLWAAVNSSYWGSYLSSSDDFGKTWTKIVNGLPANDYVHVAREDPKHRGLLYAGTEHGIFISFDDGDHWQSLRQNMPAISVRDLQIKDDAKCRCADLIAGTHGRGFWILDEVTPLRQAAAGAMIRPGWARHEVDMAGRDDVRLAGGCQCGRVRYELCGAPDHVSVCQKSFISDHRPSLSDRCR